MRSQYFCGLLFAVSLAIISSCTSNASKETETESISCSTESNNDYTISGTIIMQDSDTTSALVQSDNSDISSEKYEKTNNTDDENNNVKTTTVTSSKETVASLSLQSVGETVWEDEFDNVVTTVSSITTSGSASLESEDTTSEKGQITTNTTTYGAIEEETDVENSTADIEITTVAPVEKIAISSSSIAVTEGIHNITIESQTTSTEQKESEAFLPQESDGVVYLPEDDF